MTDKEEKAIERCNQLIKVEHANWIGISNQIAIGTVLNLIQTQQEEIEEYKTELDKIANVCNMQEGIINPEIPDIIEALKNAVTQTIREIEKKDKIIDLTIAFISTRYKEDEDINNYAKEVMERGEWTNLNKILKEYFINKVEKENK